MNEFPDHHRPLNKHLDLAAILCHVEERMIDNDYTSSFAGRRYQILRAAVEAGMRQQRLRVELRLDGELKARYRAVTSTSLSAARGPFRHRPNRAGPPAKDHNAGGRSQWMQDFFSRPSPPLWKSIG